MILRLLLLAACLSPWAAFGCTCTDLAAVAPARLKDFVERAERIVHARVAEVRGPHEARIEVIESFKGEGERLEAARGAESACGFAFARGEEHVYFVFAGRVNRCGRVAPEAAFLERLRAEKVVADPACREIARPARPAREPAVPEAPQDYEPLAGHDPQLALGVGHVRPAREEDRDDWTRRLWLPLFAAPEGPLKLWLTPGAVSPEALVETGYDTASFIVLEARASGWLQIRFGGPLASGAGWVHRCHLAAATPRLEYQPWEALFAAEERALYFRSGEVHSLRSAPAAGAKVIARVPGDPNLYGLRPLEFRGDWARVRLTVPSDQCGEAEPARRTAHEGWIRWRSRGRGPWVWYYPRGC